MMIPIRRQQIYRLFEMGRNGHLSEIFSPHSLQPIDPGRT